MKAKRTISCSKSRLKEIRKFVRQQLQPLQLSEVDQHRIILAIDEACANAIIHGHQCDPNQTLEVELTIQGGTLHVKIYDIGTANFDQLLNYEEDIQHLIRQKKKGGFGLALIHNVMDEVDYYHQDNRNVCSLTKQLPS